MRRKQKQMVCNCTWQWFSPGTTHSNAGVIKHSGYLEKASKYFTQVNVWQEEKGEEKNALLGACERMWTLYVAADS